MYSAPSPSAKGLNFFEPTAKPDFFFFGSLQILCFERARILLMFIDISKVVLLILYQGYYISGFPYRRVQTQYINVMVKQIYLIILYKIHYVDYFACGLVLWVFKPLVSVKCFKQRNSVIYKPCGV